MNNLLKQILKGKKETVIKDGKEQVGMGDMAMSIGEYVRRAFRGKRDEKKK